ncbi:MAG: HTH domain-containing protein [Nanoarchaeota archaeon]|nr:HTH domain-containing protein [Nanoarchaeota archaeon]
MGQQEVYSFLITNKGRWYSSKEVATKLKVSLGSVTNNLKKLRKTETKVKFRVIGNKYYYSIKN